MQDGCNLLRRRPGCQLFSPEPVQEQRVEPSLMGRLLSGLPRSGGDGGNLGTLLHSPLASHVQVDHFPGRAPSWKPVGGRQSHGHGPAWASRPAWSAPASGCVTEGPAFTAF